MIRALIVMLLVAPCAFAQAVYHTSFEPPAFTLGDVNGQDGWGHLSNSPTGGVIESFAHSGAQSLAIRTRETDFFGVANHLYSPMIDPAAGETGSTAGATMISNQQTHFIASLWYHTPPAPVISSRGDGRIAELDPASKASPAAQADRYAVVRVYNSTNTIAGDVRVEMTWFNSGGLTSAVVAHLDWNTWYRFDYLIQLVDGTNGAEPNDRFTLSIYDTAGALVGTACGSTWELGWRTGGFGGPATPRAINAFDFWSVTGPDTTLVGHIDDFSMTAFTPAATLGATIIGNASVCAGGTTVLSADTTAAGAPITGYTWRDASNAIVGTGTSITAGAGSYTLTVTDSLCTSATSAPFSVTEAAPLAVSISGGAIEPATLTANITGGSGTISSYIWRNSRNAIVGTGPTLNATADTYTVTVVDASCGTVTSAAFAVASAASVPTASEWALCAMAVVLVMLGVVKLR